MLKPEVAQERLKAWLIDDSVDLHRMEAGTRFEKAIRKLPSKLSAIAFGFRGLDATGKHVQDAYQNGRFENVVRNMAAAEFDRLSRPDRLKLLQISFPRMAADVERTWTALRSAPYQSGCQVKAFRAPQRADLTFSVQQGWMFAMLGLAETYREEMLEPVWLATWAPYLKRGWLSWQADIAALLATVIDAGGPVGDEVFEILRQSLTNEHEIGSMGTHVVRGLLMSSRAEGWELIEKTLLAAQRQEGLRQAILETIDIAHPTAYRRMLRIIQEHDLARFSAVARAVNVWFGFAWDSASVKVINGIIETVLMMLDDEAARRKALAGSDAELAFLALWAAAFEDAPASILLAERFLKHKSAEMRFIALTHLGHLGLDEAQAVRWSASDDDDLRVALRAVGSITTPSVGDDGAVEDAGQPKDDSFERLERLIQRLPVKPIELKPLVWPWTKTKICQETLAPTLLTAIGKRPPTRLLPYLSAMDPWRRRAVVELFANQKKWDVVTRDTLIGLAGDASAEVRAAAFGALTKIQLSDAEIDRLSTMLTRKSADLRSGIIGLLMNLSDARALAGADSLLGSKDGQQRLAGLELLRQLNEQQRAIEESRQRAATFREQRGKLTKDEERQLDAILTVKSDASVLTLDNALGLMDPVQLTPVTAPRNLKTKLITPAAIACLKELDELVHQHRETPIVTNPRSKETELLGSINWGFPYPDWSKKPESEAKRLPLREVWEEWFEKRPPKPRDADGMELLRADCWREYALEWDHENWQKWAKRKPYRKAMLAPLDLPAAAYPKYHFVDPQTTGVAANYGLNDQLIYDLPIQYTIHKAYRRGEIPWWDPYGFAGRPLLADAHINGTDPVRVAVYLLLPFELAYNWTQIIHFFLSGLGLFLLLRHWKFNPLVCLLLSFTYEFAGYFSHFFGYSFFINFIFKSIPQQIHLVEWKLVEKFLLCLFCAVSIRGRRSVDNFLGDS